MNAEEQTANARQPEAQAVEASIAEDSVEAIKEGSKEGVKEGSKEAEQERSEREFETGESEKERRAIVETARQVDSEREARQPVEAVPQPRPAPQAQGETTVADAGTKAMESVAQGNDILTAAKDAVIGTAVDTVLEKGRKAITPATPEAAGDAIEAVEDAAQFAPVVKGATEGAGKLAGAARSAAAFGSKLLPIVGAAATAASALGTIRDEWNASGRAAVNMTGEYDPLLGAQLRAQMATQRTMGSVFDGLDAKDAQTIQNTLIDSGVNFQSDSFDEGYNFSSDMVVKYGMDAGKAAKRYAEAVQYGTMTVEDLDETMQALAKSAKDSGKSLEQLNEEYDNSVKEWSRVTGNLGEAYVMASETVKAAAEAGVGASSYSGFASSQAALVDTDNPLHREMVADDFDQYVQYTMEANGYSDISEIPDDVLNKLRDAAIRSAGAKLAFGDMKYTVNPEMGLKIDNTKIGGKTLDDWLKDERFSSDNKNERNDAIEELAAGLDRLQDPRLGGPNRLDYWDIKDMLLGMGVKEYDLTTPYDTAKTIAGFVRADDSFYKNVVQESEAPGGVDDILSEDSYNERTGTDVTWWNGGRNEELEARFDSQGLSYGGAFVDIFGNTHDMTGWGGYSQARTSEQLGNGFSINYDSLKADELFDSVDGEEGLSQFEIDGVSDEEMQILLGSLIDLGVVSEGELRQMTSGQRREFVGRAASLYSDDYLSSVEDGKEAYTWYNAVLASDETGLGEDIRELLAQYIKANPQEAGMQVNVDVTVEPNSEQFCKAYAKWEYEQKAAEGNA